MTYRITHTTRYRYTAPVDLCHNEARLRPRTGPRQRCLAHHLSVDPPATVQHERLDFFGNAVLYFSVERPHDTLTLTAVSTVAAEADPIPDLAASRPWDAVAASLRTLTTPEALDARPFVLDSPMVPAGGDLAAYAWPSFSPGRPLLDAVYDLTRRIHREFVYDPTFTTVATPLDHVLAEHRGVCQDFAHLAIGCLRSLGLPARYVSGYLETEPPPGMPRLQGADASHAWFAVFDPDAGWIDLDPTNDQLVGGRHITTAWGRDYTDVTPVKGVVFGGGAHSLDVAVDVTRIETPPDSER